MFANLLFQVSGKFDDAVPLMGSNVTFIKRGSGTVVVDWIDTHVVRKSDRSAALKSATLDGVASPVNDPCPQPQKESAVVVYASQSFRRKCKGAHRPLCNIQLKSRLECVTRADHDVGWNGGQICKQLGVIFHDLEHVLGLNVFVHVKG